MYTFLVVVELLISGRILLLQFQQRQNQLNKFAGEPVEVYVNNKKFAEGEVVVIDQNFAVRITTLITKQERFASIGS